jgi:ATP-dependent phosphoenolpyruvate carboxykinase
MPIKVWLINTGWTGGPNTGNRQIEVHARNDYRHLNGELITVVSFIETRCLGIAHKHNLIPSDILNLETPKTRIYTMLKQLNLQKIHQLC